MAAVEHASVPGARGHAVRPRAAEVVIACVSASVSATRAARAGMHARASANERGRERGGGSKLPVADGVSASGV